MCPLRYIVFAISALLAIFVLLWTRKQEEDEFLKDKILEETETETRKTTVVDFLTGRYIYDKWMEYRTSLWKYEMIYFVHQINEIVRLGLNSSFVDNTLKHNLMILNMYFSSLLSIPLLISFGSFPVFWSRTPPTVPALLWQYRFLMWFLQVKPPTIQFLDPWLQILGSSNYQVEHRNRFHRV